jgi:membrane protein DedA with SNARE-associated domain
MVTGMFRDRDSAERAYGALSSRGYTDRDLNLAMSDETRKRYFSDDVAVTELGNKAAKGAGVGGTIGATAGAIAAAIAAVGTSLVVPGLGLVIAGPAAAAVAGAGAGGVAGGLLGALVGWAIGLYGGRPFLERRGRWFHLGPERLDRAERWFERWEDQAVLIGRLTPVVRSFVSIPSGLFGEPLRRYTLLTLAGSAIWCFFFAGLGWALGSGYKNVDHVTHVIEALIVIALIGFAVYLLRRRSLTRR